MNLTALLSKVESRRSKENLRERIIDLESNLSASLGKQRGLIIKNEKLEKKLDSCIKLIKDYTVSFLKYKKTISNLKERCESLRRRNRDIEGSMTAFKNYIRTQYGEDSANKIDFYMKRLK